MIIRSRPNFNGGITKPLRDRDDWFGIVYTVLNSFCDSGGGPPVSEAQLARPSRTQRGSPAGRLSVAQCREPCRKWIRVYINYDIHVGLHQSAMFWSVIHYILWKNRNASIKSMLVFNWKNIYYCSYDKQVLFYDISTSGSRGCHHQRSHEIER